MRRACLSRTEGDDHLIPPSPHLILSLALILELGGARGRGRCLLLVTHPPLAGCSKDLSKILQTDWAMSTTQQTLCLVLATTQSPPVVENSLAALGL